MTRLKFPSGTPCAILIVLLTFFMSILCPDSDAQTPPTIKEQQSKKKIASKVRVIAIEKTNNAKKVTRKVAQKKPASVRKKTTRKVVQKKSASARKKTTVATTRKTKKKSTAHTPPVSASSFTKQISARSAIIIDARSGETLFAKAPDNPRQPASTIKILTGMIALKSLSGSEQVPVSSWAAGQPSSKVHLNPKKHYQANDLINAVLLASANDASVALAEKIAGSESSFANMMTERARLMGARNTVCKTASGLTAKGQTSTARDLAVIFRRFMEDPAFAERMKKVKVNTTYGTTLRNHNKALWQVEGTQGGKTGFTNAARQTYVGKFKRGNNEIVVAVMGSETMWNDVKKLVQRGFALQDGNSTASKTLPDKSQKIVARATDSKIPGQPN